MLKLGPRETIAVIVVGNLVGCAIFAAFTTMGHKTGVNQMVLARAAFGRRGAYLPSALMFVMTLGRIGVNTILSGQDRRAGYRGRHGADERAGLDAPRRRRLEPHELAALGCPSGDDHETARAFGLTVPQSLLLRANTVIE